MNGTEVRSVRDVLRGVAAARVSRLQEGALADRSEAVATLARLRRCDPAAVGTEPTVWAITLGDLPAELTEYSSGRPNEPTAAERALHATLVLYAMHQQSQGQGVNLSGVSLGRAVGQLARARAGGDEPDSSVMNRFHQVALANDFEGRVYHLRGLVQLMRAENPPIPLDHGLLAVDLWQLADKYQDSNKVLTRWGRDLHYRPKNANNSTQSEETK